MLRCLLTSHLHLFSLGGDLGCISTAFYSLGKLYIYSIYILGPDSVSTKPSGLGQVLVNSFHFKSTGYLKANMQSYPFHSVLGLEPLANGHRHAVIFQSCPQSGNE